MTDTNHILMQVKSGKMTVDKAARLIDAARAVNLGFACVDTDRLRRRGMPEVIYCPGKTSDQIVKIARALMDGKQHVLATRVSAEQRDVVLREIPTAKYHADARIITVNSGRKLRLTGLVVVASAGTADIPVAEEAALTAEHVGARVKRVFDVGVAGLHRLTSHIPLMRSARVLIVVAGMEGALPSVIGGLVNKPLIAVPTSTGYGTGIKGFSAMLAMLNTCVPGVTVVNIDNGFGAGIAAAMINRRA
ncbi:MAG: nickel pincer cofactor biosynthesis protein LarB [bacterium]